ncbi:collagen-like protein [Streptococcus sp. 53]|uniref:collagen-like protein n=1 Tax=Streptococcus sp. 53 TaxID=2582679 RepID=UPI0023D98698|nr:collagen-like protein [Streptococcus sp. 53]
MTETIPVRVQHKRMSASDWASSTLVLLDGELGIESDTGKVKVGNGSDHFSALQYLTGPKGDRGERGETGPRGADGVVRFEGSAAERALAEYAKKAEIPIYRIAKGDIPGGGVGVNATITTNNIMNPDGIKVGDIIEDYWNSVSSVNQGFWKVTAVNGTNVSVQGIGTRDFPTPYNDNELKRRVTALENRPTFDTLTETQRNSLRGPAGAKGATGPAGPRGADGDRGRDGAPGQNIINQNGGQPMKYWSGTRAQYDAIPNKDSNTIYDIYSSS